MTAAIPTPRSLVTSQTELARGMLESFGVDGDGSHHRGNVAYWQLDESDAPTRAIEACLSG